ncbi:hypothetical protein C8R45DRAFT_766598, partial [Mycena sanguinolenta]
LWNLQTYLTEGQSRTSWCFLVDFILMNFLEKSYLNVRPGQILNVFMQDVDIPISSRTPLPDDIKQMILVARNYHLRFTALAFSRDIKLKMPVWKHPGMNRELYKKACRRDSATCLRLNHQVRDVQDVLIIADRKTSIARKPHQINPSGIGRKNCGCPACTKDRFQRGCKNPGECIETAKMIINSIFPKWHPTLENLDIHEELALTPTEIAGNDSALDTDTTFSFDPNITLSECAYGFRIFAAE